MRGAPRISWHGVSLPFEFGGEAVPGWRLPLSRLRTWLFMAISYIYSQSWEDGLGLFDYVGKEECFCLILSHLKKSHNWIIKTRQHGSSMRSPNPCRQALKIGRASCREGGCQEVWL